MSFDDDAFRGDTAAVKRLLADGVRPTSRALQIAARHGHLAIVQLFVDHKQSPNVVDEQDETGWTALLLAASSGHTSVVDWLLFAGASVHLVTKYKCSAVYVAAVDGHCRVLESVVACGADIDFANHENESPLCKAARKARIDCVRLLLDLRADSNTTDKEGRNLAQVDNDDIRKLVQKTAKLSVKKRQQIRVETLNRLGSELSNRLMRYAQPEIVEICLSLSFAALPANVLFAIISWRRNFDLIAPHESMQAIESVCSSIRKINGTIFIALVFVPLKIKYEERKGGVAESGKRKSKKYCFGY